MSIEKPYHQSYGHDQKYYVDGPAPGGECSYYGGTCYPSFRMETKEEAERAAQIANIAYRKGYEKAQFDMRRAMGIKE